MYRALLNAENLRDNSQLSRNAMLIVPNVIVVSERTSSSPSPPRPTQGKLTTGLPASHMRSGLPKRTIVELFARCCCCCYAQQCHRVKALLYYPNFFSLSSSPLHHTPLHSWYVKFSILAAERLRHVLCTHYQPLLASALYPDTLVHQLTSSPPPVFGFG